MEVWQLQKPFKNPSTLQEPFKLQVFDKKTKGSGVTLANKSAIKSIPQNRQLAKELHKPIIRKFKKRKVYSAF